MKANRFRGFVGAALVAARGFASTAAPAGAIAVLAGCVQKALGPASAPSTGAADPGSGQAEPTPTPGLTPQYPQAAPIDERKPVKIRADRLRYDDGRKETSFLGHVKAVQDTTVLSADRLISSTQGETARVSGNVKVEDLARKVELRASEGDYSGSLTEANLRGGVRLNSVDPYSVPVTVTGQSAWMHTVSRLAEVRGGVVVERGRITATAGTARVEGAENLLVLEGAVDAALGRSRIESDRAELDGKGRRASFEGRVRAKVIPKELREASEHPERP